MDNQQYNPQQNQNPNYPPPQPQQAPVYRSPSQLQGPQTTPLPAPQRSGFSPLLPAALILGLLIGVMAGFVIGSSGKGDLENRVAELEQAQTDNQPKLDLYDKYEEQIQQTENFTSDPTYEEIQKRARDTERKADLNALRTQLEVFYTDNGYYPGIADVNTANLVGLDREALLSPEGVVITEGTTATDSNYYYSPLECDASRTQCQRYEVFTLLEQDGSLYSYESLQ